MTVCQRATNPASSRVGVLDGGEENPTMSYGSATNFLKKRKKLSAGEGAESNTALASAARKFAAE